MKITQHLLLKCSSLLILLLISLLQTSHATNSHICTPSSCGIIRNISSPFRLKHDPKHCGNPKYELSCENNVAFLYLNSQKYKVKAINYHNFTIRLVDVSVNNNTCSFPKCSAYPHNFTDRYPYSTGGLYRYTIKLSVLEQDIPEVAQPINFITCPHPLNNSSSLTDTNNCHNILKASNSSNGARHTYIKVGHMEVSDLTEMCRVDVIVMTSWNFKDTNNVSVSEIHDSLLYGFELSWFNYPCSKCKQISHCRNYKDRRVTCSYGQLPSVPLIVMIIIVVVVVSVGVSIPAKIIIGIAVFLGILFTLGWEWSFNLSNMMAEALLVYIGAHLFYDALCITSCIISTILEVHIWEWDVMLAEKFEQLFLFYVVRKQRRSSFHFPPYPLFPGFFFALFRFIIGISGIVGLLIYKYRRRHLSMFHAIESFLRSDDNKLMPIRYSYSDIQKMTGGFREKLGQGGYGTVYKGKLRSGYDVAVKLLGKPGGNDQDFMNEIATIGRIHHVNIAKLVGYCAERSKRALVFDFMPNGSLDKYIYSQEKMYCLSWEKKYEIAVGVARGIEYLHRGCDIQILHFDIKPHNILLDDKFIPKITDFGLAKFYSTEKKTVTLTAVRGTVGYVAPELINRGFGKVSYKADIYSFGMLLIEMVYLKKDLMRNNEESSKYFPDWIYDCFDQGRDIEFGKTDEENDQDDNDGTRKIARKMTIVALWCIQMSPDNRPSMNKVLEMLEGEVEHLQIPQRPIESTQAVLDDYQSLSTSSTDSVSLLPHDAAPSFEITVLE